MRCASYFTLASATLLALVVSISAAGPTISLERVSMRLTYTAAQEKRTRASASAEAPDFSVGADTSVVVDADDMLIVQAASTEDGSNGDPAYPQQVFLRIVRKSDGRDAVYVMRKKSIEMRTELSLRKEIYADSEFWQRGHSYAIEVVVGDTRMAKGITWVAVESLMFSGESSSVAKAFAVPAGNVFDFDIGVKKHLQPEFTSPIPPSQKQAPFNLVIVALIALGAPFPLVLVAWMQLGVIPLTLPESMSERLSVVGFEACLLGHMASLVMFWLRWNIVYTWKVMSVIMIPTVFLGHQVLSAGASRHVRSEEKGRKTE
jgi:hypothetical protein